MNRNLITLGKSTTANAQSSSVLHVGLPQAIDRTDPDGVDAALAFATKPLKKLFEIILTLMSLGIVTSVFTYDKDGKGKKVDLPKLDTSDEEGMKKAVDQCCGLADDFVRTWRNPEDHSENLGMVSVELVGWFPEGGLFRNVVDTIWRRGNKVSGGSEQTITAKTDVAQFVMACREGSVSDQKAEIKQARGLELQERQVEAAERSATANERAASANEALLKISMQQQEIEALKARLSQVEGGVDDLANATAEELDRLGKSVEDDAEEAGAEAEAEAEVEANEDQGDIPQSGKRKRRRKGASQG